MVQKFEYKRATMEDIDELVRTRIIVLRAANKLSDDEDMSVVEEESKAYYRRALETGEHIAYLVYDNGAFVGAGGVSFYQVMPTYHNPTGKKAYIMNMYTAPEYRRQGIAFHTLDLLINDAKKQGVLQIALEATDMGRPLYERCVGGSVVKGEDSLLGAIREAKEEVGVDLMPENGQVLFTKTRKIIEGKIFNDIMDVWLFEYDGEVDLGNATTDEVAQVAWMNREQIKELFEQEVFVGTLEYFFTEVDKERR